MADANESVDRSLAAVRGLTGLVRRFDLWSGAWIGIVAIRKGEQWILFLFRAHLVGPGVRVPAPSKVFDATASDVIVRVLEVGLDDFWRTLEELARGEATRLTGLAGVRIQCHTAKNQSVWSGPNTYAWSERTHLCVSHWGNAPFHDIFGFDLFDRLGPQLRGLERPYESLREIADGMVFFGGSGCDTNNSNPMSEVSAEFPISMASCFYNRAHRGIEIQIQVGASVPLQRLSATVTPEPRQRLSGTDFESQRDGENRELVALVPCEEPRAEVAVSLQFEDVHIASARIPVEKPASIVWGDAANPRPEDWENALGREFHWTLRSLRRRLRTVLPSRVAEVAEWRIRESILLRDAHPFFAVASAASVAEVLLKERLAKVTQRVRGARWTALRAGNERLPKRLPEVELLKFDHAIRLAQEVGLIGDIDSSSVDILRAARNQIHLNRKSRLPLEDFSPVRASHAILATLDLCKRLGSVSRARPRKRRPSTPGGLGQPGKP